MGGMVLVGDQYQVVVRRSDGVETSTKKKKKKEKEEEAKDNLDRDDYK